MNLDAAMIFAAGFGTRMRPLTDHIPKPMVPLLGRPMIDYAIDTAREAGAKTIVANLHYKPDTLRSHLAAQGVIAVTEAPDILDTGGGLLNARVHFDSEAVWTMNPDAVWDGPNPFSFALAHWDPGKMDALLVTIEPNRAVGAESPVNLSIDHEGKLAWGNETIYGGVQIIKLSTLNDMEHTAFSLRVIWDRLIGQERCFGCIYPGRWSDVGHPDGIAHAETLLRDGGRA